MKISHLLRSAKAGLGLMLVAAAPGLAAAQPQMSAAVLPSGRSVDVGETATFFVTMVNSGDQDAINCGHNGAVGEGSGAFSTVFRSLAIGPGGVNSSPITVPAGESVSFLLTATPSEETVAEFNMEFGCNNGSAPDAPGVETIFLTALDGAENFDILAAGATPTGDGHVQIAAAGRRGVTSVAALRVAGDSPATAQIRVRPDSPFLDSQAEILICETDASAICITPRQPFLDLSWAPSQERYFAAFTRAPSSGGLPFLPDFLRLKLIFEDDQGYQRGATSVAISSPAPEDASNAPAGIYAGRMAGDPLRLYVLPDGRQIGTVRQSGFFTPQERIFLSDGQVSQPAPGEGARWRGDYVIQNGFNNSSGAEMRLVYDPARAVNGRFFDPTGDAKDEIARPDFTFGSDLVFSAMALTEAFENAGTLSDYLGLYTVRETGLYGATGGLTIGATSVSGSFAYENGGADCDFSAIPAMASAGPFILLDNISLSANCWPGPSNAFSGFIVMLDETLGGPLLIVHAADPSSVLPGALTLGFVVQLEAF